MELFVNEYLALGGFAALIALIVNTAKYFGYVKDGDAGKISSMLNTVGLVLFLVLKFYSPESVNQIDSTVLEWSTLFGSLLALVLQFGSSLLTHEIFKKLEIPVLGYSNK
jgi:hypothetical protein